MNFVKKCILVTTIWKIFILIKQKQSEHVGVWGMNKAAKIDMMMIYKSGGDFLYVVYKIEALYWS